MGMVCAKPCNLHVFFADFGSALSENIVFYMVFGGRVPAAEHPDNSPHNQAEALERGRGEVNLSLLSVKRCLGVRMFERGTDLLDAPRGSAESS